MAQVNWVYLDDQGGRHRVGLYHGDRSGHLMIHANMRVVQIDFSVLDTKTYSFFIEDELCEVIVEKMKNGHFGYEFRVNKTVDTPRNRIRKVDNKRNNRQLAWFVTGVVAVIAILFFGLKQYGKYEDERRMAKTSIAHNLNKLNLELLAAEGRPATGILHVEEINNKRVGVYTFKIADSSEIRGVFPVADTGLIMLQNGFPLRAGDAFEAKYLPSDPQVHRIEMFRPTRSTINRYISAALAVEMRTHPELSKEKNLCKVLTIAEAQGWMSLANFIFQENSPAQDARRNQESYLRMLRDPEVLKALEQRCWDK